MISISDLLRHLSLVLLLLLLLLLLRVLRLLQRSLILIVRYSLLAR